MSTTKHPLGATTIESAEHQSLFHRVLWGEAQAADPQVLLQREWLVTNGLGGYASGTIAGIPTRRYHGLLVAALPAPLGRTVMLNSIAEELRLPNGTLYALQEAVHPHGHFKGPGVAALKEFRLEMGLPVWEYEMDAWVVEKRVLMPHLQNTVYLRYRLLSGQGPVRLHVRPSIHFRPHDADVAASNLPLHKLAVTDQGTEVLAERFPPLRMRLNNTSAATVLDGGRLRDVFYPMERDRGYECHGRLWSPGYFRGDLAPGAEAAFLASTEAWDTVSWFAAEEAFRAEHQRRERLLSLADPVAQAGPGAQLVLGADQFIITPATRLADAARAHAVGDEVRTVIAGYHWFTDWGRDTMISLEGLTLLTGRHAEAGYVLRGFAHHLRDGLIPNLFPEGEHEGVYHTADATLWYFHAIDRYLQRTRDRDTLRMLLPGLRDILQHHLRGTRFGIHADPRDGLLRQGQAGYQLTWMDAKVGDWVVTPRRGKTVEINALWYNALRLMANWMREEEHEAAGHPYAETAQQVAASFNERFWYAAGGYLYDVIDGEHGDDPSMRPNQVLAISLPHPVLDPSRWHAVLDQVTRRLLTPMGLRSLAPGEPDYRARYDGDLRARDAAYHQGTVWAWLIGPFVDAWLRVHPGDYDTARSFLVGFEAHLGEACIGSVSEVFDAEAPYTPRGCIAQAWSVAEVLRAWVKTESAAQLPDGGQSEAANASEVASSP